MERRSFLKALIGAPIAAKVAVANAATWTAEQVARPLVHVPVVRDFDIVRRYGDQARFTQMITETLETYRRELAENISAHNPLLLKLKQQRKIIMSQTGSDRAE